MPEKNKSTKHKATPDPASKAYNQAEKDILHDPELSDPDPTDDLDEGELARKDNSDEEAVDQLRHDKTGKPHAQADKPYTRTDKLHPHSGKGSEK